jgi:rhodanese-related sulfurtransferase/polyisoprenoid-binding protein YceI
MNVTISCNQLQERMAAGAVVVDVMTPEDYAACHIEGATNACMYEMAFLDRIAERVPDRDTELVVYDTSGTTRAAEAARERLIQAGYSVVSILKGGLSDWRSAGLPVETGLQAGLPEPKLQEGTYRIDVERSALEWIGRNLNNRHFGRIAIKEGTLLIQGGRLTGGSIVLDMNAITNLDLQDPAWRDMLLRHLKSDDFFAVERFPTASFRLTGWEAVEGASAEITNGIASGELTIRDITRPINFPAVVAPQADGSIKAHASFDIDRTLWNVCYGSGKLFERLGMHLVHDIINLELFILAR